MGSITGFIGAILGILFSLAIDVGVFCSIAAIPLAALVFLGVISNGMAIGTLIGVAILVGGRVIIVGTRKALSQ